MNISYKTLLLCACLSVGPFFATSSPAFASSPNGALDLKQLGLSQIDVDHQPSGVDPYAIITSSAIVVRAPDTLIKDVVSAQKSQTGKTMFWFYHAGRQHFTDRADIVEPLIAVSQKVNALSHQQMLAYRQIGQATRKMGQCGRDKALARSRAARERMSRMNGTPTPTSPATGSQTVPINAECGSYEADIKRLEQESKQRDSALADAVKNRDRAAKSAEMKLLAVHDHESAK